MLHDWLNMLLKQTFFTCHSLAKHVYISRASEAVFPLSLQKNGRVKQKRSQNCKENGKTILCPAGIIRK